MPSILTICCYSYQEPRCRTGASQNHHSSTRIKDFCPMYRRSVVLWARKHSGGGGGNLTACISQLTNALFSASNLLVSLEEYMTYMGNVFTSNAIAAVISHSKRRRQHLWCNKDKSPKRNMFLSLMFGSI